MVDAPEVGFITGTSMSTNRTYGELLRARWGTEHFAPFMRQIMRTYRFTGCSTMLRPLDLYMFVLGLARTCAPQFGLTLQPKDRWLPAPPTTPSSMKAWAPCSFAAALSSVPRLSS